MAEKVVSISSAAGKKLPALSAKKKRVDTIVLDREYLKRLQRPDFQRPVKVNLKVREIAAEIANTGVFPGILTVALFAGKQWVLDGQHRIEAFLLSERDEIYADVHYYECSSAAEMSEIYVELNQALVRFTPDDILRAAEEGSEPLKHIRSKCPFVGYGHVRRGPGSPIISMSSVLRCWSAGVAEVPTSKSVSAAELARTLTMDTAKQCTSYLTLAYQAWGGDANYARLWLSLNTALCMWLYIRTVLMTERRGNHRTVVLTAEQFKSGLMALSASSNYLEYLVNRQLNDDHRAPTYDRVKRLFATRLGPEFTPKKILLPSPAWAWSTSGKGSL